MKRTLLVDPIGKLPEKNGLLKKLVLINRLERLNRSINSFHLPFLGFRASSRIFAIISSAAGNGKRACSERDFPIKIFACICTVSNQMRFDMNGKRPWSLFYRVYKEMNEFEIALYLLKRLVV